MSGELDEAKQAHAEARQRVEMLERLDALEEFARKHTTALIEMMQVIHTIQGELDNIAGFDPGRVIPGKAKPNE
jgi:DNA repair ATPase RecN